MEYNEIVSYQYTYLLLGLTFLIFWLILFIFRKDTRREMLVMSTLYAAIGIPADHLYIIDWWNPKFIFPALWIESILMGFAMGGVFSVIFEEVLRKNIRLPSKTRPARPARLIIVCLLAVIIFLVTVYIFKKSTFLATVLGVGLPAAYIFAERSDLLVQGLATAIMALIIASLAYTFVNFLTPGWVGEFYYLKNTKALIIGNIPVDDIVWYFFAGLFMGPLYAYWKEGRLVKKT